MNIIDSIGIATLTFFLVQFAGPITVFVLVREFSNSHRALRIAVPAFWLLLATTSLVSLVEASYPIAYLNVLLSVFIVGRVIVLRRRFTNEAPVARETAEGSESGSETDLTNEEFRERGGGEGRRTREDEPSCTLVFDSREYWSDKKEGYIDTSILSAIFLNAAEGWYTLKIGYHMRKVSAIEFKVNVWAEVKASFWGGWSPGFDVNLRSETEFAKVYCNLVCKPNGVGDEDPDVHTKSGATTLAKFESLARQGNTLPVKLTMIAAMPADVGGQLKVSAVSVSSPQTPVGQLGVNFEVVGRVADNLSRKITPNFTCIASDGETAART